MKKCGYCNKTLSSQKKFCSFSCRGKVISRISIARGWTMKGRKHTEATRIKMAESKLGKTGKDSNNWRGGSSRAYKNGYYSPQYKEWREAVFKRDSYTCQDCGITGNQVYLTAHHIKSFTHYPELRFEVSNGKTLCEICHSETDNYKGRANRGFKRAGNNNLIITV